MISRAVLFPLFLLCLLLGACATPGAIKNASGVQLEAFSSARQSVDSYVDLVDKEIAAINALRAKSLDLTAVVMAVEKIASDPATAASPVEAVDALSGELASGRRDIAATPDNLHAAARAHRRNMAHLKTLLQLLEQNQALIDLYLNTDLGPSQAQLEQLGEGLRSFALGGDGE